MPPVRLLLAIAILLTGCEEAPELPPLLSDQPDLPDGMVGLRELSGGGECPSLDSPGAMTMNTGGGIRRVTWLFPAERKGGLPFLMVFHGLGASARSMIPRMQLQALADSGVVVAVPEGIPTARFGWGAGPKGIHDVMLVDDMRRCAHERLGVDLARVHATGFSAGGLWTTLLLMHASELLASVTIFSGGDLPPFVNYQAPEKKVPALVIWGGKTDVYRGRGFSVQFDGAARRVSEGLARDGHFVVRCNHGNGHVLPRDYSGMLHQWTVAHTFGKPSPLTHWTTESMRPGCEVLAP
jgi:predicted esterase